MPSLRISLLGPLTATLDNQPVPFRTDAQRALLAYLAAHQGIPQRRDTLAGLLSPDRNDKDALTYLRNRLTRLRSSLKDAAATPPWLTIDRKQITLRTGGDIIIDVTEFEQRLSTVENHAHRQLAGCPICMARLEEAVDLVRGEFLAGLNFPSDVWEAWLLGQREHLQQRSMDAMTWLRDARMVHNQWDEVLLLAQRQLTLEPWHEAAHRAIMQAHHQLGDRNAALAQYEQCQAILRDELGVEPEPETTALFEQMQAVVQSPVFGVQSRESKVQSSKSKVQSSKSEVQSSKSEVQSSKSEVQSSKLFVTGNLPPKTTRFFGRESEQTHLLERLVDPQYRLITLVGTGGIGKTRLALEVGQQVKQSFPDGVWFIALDAVKSDAEQLKIAVGEAIGLAQDDNQLTGDQVGAILRDKQMLLIFDNCETVLDDLGFIGTWLNRARDVVILATSREPLNFQAESVVLLEGLGIRDNGLGSEALGPAEAMFLEQAQMARDDFGVTDENLQQVRQICQLVDGLPLGIALAAAWVRRRSLTQIIDSIGQSLDFLSTRMSDVDPRHRSMKAVFETSWQMLDVEEQMILSALSIFPSSFTAEAAQQIAGAQLFDLDLLCEKSLLQQQHEGERYQMHSLVRQFAAQKLRDRKQTVEETFIEYYLVYAQSSQDDYAQLAPEWNNFTAAIAKAHALEAWQIVLDLVQVLDKPWFRQVRFSEMRMGLALALEAAEGLGNEEALAQTLLRLGEVEMELNTYEKAETHLNDGLNRLMRLEEGLGIARAKYFLGRIHVERTEDEKALAYLADSKRIFMDEGDEQGIAKNLTLIAFCHLRHYSDVPSALALLEESISLQQQLPQSAAYVEALRYLARVKSMLGHHVDAEQHLVEAAQSSRAQYDLGEYAAVLFEQTALYRQQGTVDQGLLVGQECLEHFRQLGSLRWEGLLKMQLGLLHQANRNLSQALSFVCEALQIFIDLDDLYEKAYAYYFLHDLYEKIGEAEKSVSAKAEAIRLNGSLQDPTLAARLSSSEAEDQSLPIETE